MSVDYAHTASANHQRQRKAKAIAKWCHRHGITPDHLVHASASDRRQLATAVRLPTPREPADGNGIGETWQIVCVLLQQRRIWDQGHQLDPPAAPVDCLPCLLRSCRTHLRGHACSVCRQPLHPTALTEGYLTHPTCQPRPNHP